MNIEEKIKEIAHKKKNRILLVEGDDSRVIETARIAIKEKTCTPVLLCKTKPIQELNGAEYIVFTDHPKLDFYARKIVKIRKHKGITKEDALELLKNPNYFASILVKLGEVEGAFGGNVYSTAEWMRPVFQIIGKKEGVKVVSACCIFPIKDKTYVLSDTDFNIEPTHEELACIAINANDFAKDFGFNPKLALLSYSTHGSGDHKSLSLIRKAISIVKKERSDIIIDGEIQLDAAINPDAAKKKCPDSILKGCANVLIFPDITVGNVLVHALFQWTDYSFYGSFPVGVNGLVMNGGRSMGPDELHKSLLALCMRCNL